MRRPGTRDYLVPPAGGWWFKTLWYRDAFEGVLNSLETLLKFPEEGETVKGLIRLAQHDQDKHSGRILRGILEYKHLEPSYDSSDGTLLCFITANAYILKTGDLDLALEALPHAWTAIRCFYEDNVRDSHLFQIDGPPRVDIESGLLLSAPRHSWIDTRDLSVSYCGQEARELPSRFSEQFVQDLWDHLSDQIPDKKDLVDLLFAPNFFLPEINAQWIALLQGTLETVDLVASRVSPSPVITDLQGRATDLQSLKGIVQATLARAEKSFEQVFWNPENGFLFNTVYEDRAVKDTLECEAGVTAAAMLGEAVFSRQKLAAIWECARDKLLIQRRLVEYGEETLPFGLVARDVSQGAYYGDAQYHGDVTWPRSTPYLIKLLRLLGEDEVIREILINTLDHQMSEAAIFYNQELFSKPAGNNPRPDERTGENPVPVKNPVQFWSHWCDAFIEFFEERRS
jgi:glycogen debranching enzyme